MCLGTAGFDTDTFQHAIEYQNEDHFIFYLVIWLVVCGVNRFRVMIDFLRDGSACPVFCKTLQFSGLNRGHVRNVSHEINKTQKLSYFREINRK